MAEASELFIAFFSMEDWMENVNQSVSFQLTNDILWLAEVCLAQIGVKVQLLDSQLNGESEYM